jgi:hypothetical protein
MRKRRKKRTENCGECAYIELIVAMGFFFEYSLDIEDGVGRVHSSLVLGGITDQTLLVGEGNERGSGVRTLVVGN